MPELPDDGRYGCLPAIILVMVFWAILLAAVYGIVELLR